MGHVAAQALHTDGTSADTRASHLLICFHTSVLNGVTLHMGHKYETFACSSPALTWNRQ